MKWRLILDTKHDGAYNMALDEAIMESVIAKKSPPTIRFYSWDPACLTLGYFQRAAESINQDGVNRLEVDTVRRPTGGRAILHETDEITYSIVAPLDILGGSVLETYFKINCALAAGFINYGIPVKLAPNEEGEFIDPEIFTKTKTSIARDIKFQFEKKSAACFDTPSAYELVYNGRKIVGSAQTRRSGVLLQQGSIPVSMNLDRISEVMLLEEDIPSMLKERVATILDVKPNFVPSNLISYLVRGLRVEFECEFETSPANDFEHSILDDLIEKYKSNEWLLKR